MLPTTAGVLAEKLASLRARGMVAPASRILLVNDGSKDETWRLARALHDDPASLGLPNAVGMFCAISFAHNEGHQNALFAGLMHALERGCDCAVSLDADLQDDPNAIDEMLCAHAQGAEVVYGVRSSRASDSVFKRDTAEAFYGLIRWLGVEMVSDSADYRLMGRRSIEALSRYGEANLFLRGIVPALGFTSAKVEYVRAPRAAGESKYPLGKMLSFALEGITSFSVRPVRLVLLAGLGALGPPEGAPACRPGLRPCTFVRVAPLSGRSGAPQGLGALGPPGPPSACFCARRSSFGPIRGAEVPHPLNSIGCQAHLARLCRPKWRPNRQPSTAREGGRGCYPHPRRNRAIS